MKEQSHKREMGAALRGDFERLRARRGGEMPLIESPAQSEEAASVMEPESVSEPQNQAAPVAESAERTTGGSWLDRLRGRG